MPGGRGARSKGNRIEREIKQLHLDAEVPCERVPLSGGAGGSFVGDLLIGPHATPGARYFRGEVKARAGGQGFATLERWLGSNDLLFLRRDRTAPLIVLPWDIYLELVKARLCPCPTS